MPCGVSVFNMLDTARTTKLKFLCFIGCNMNTHDLLPGLFKRCKPGYVHNNFHGAQRALYLSCFVLLPQSISNCLSSPIHTHQYTRTIVAKSTSSRLAGEKSFDRIWFREALFALQNCTFRLHPYIQIKGWQECLWSLISVILPVHILHLCYFDAILSCHPLLGTFALLSPLSSLLSLLHCLTCNFN